MAAWYDWVEGQMHTVNFIFNNYVRDSQSSFVQFIWMSSVLFGWVKIILISKSIVEFFLRRYFWGKWWKR